MPTFHPDRETREEYRARQNAIKRNWSAKNRDKVAEAKKKYYWKHRRRLLAEHEAWRKSERGIKWLKESKENEKKREWRRLYASRFRAKVRASKKRQERLFESMKAIFLKKQS